MWKMVTSVSEIGFILCTHKLAGHIKMEQDKTSEIETT